MRPPATGDQSTIDSQPSTTPNVLRLGLLQHACPVGAEPGQNLAKAEAMIRDAAGRGAQLVATQELFTSYYFCQAEDESRFALAEPIPGPTSQRLAELAKALGVVIAASLFERRAAGVYHNTSIVIDEAGRIVGRYRKMHIPDDPRFYEKFYFAPGDLGWQVHRTSAGDVGTLICWDQWFPEAARLTALRGAQVLLYPTAIGWYHGEEPEERPRQVDAWRTVQRAHAITNGVFVAAINRVGVEDDLQFWGSSFVCDPAGRVIAEASETDEQVIIADCDLSLIDQQRRAWPFLRDRRIDAYEGIDQRMLDE